ncbi:MAG TPA: DUF885 domain-containing protein [Candidatus Xenobia bacterium]|jgi:uncharacterized protein (DUF885 family)
MPAVAAPSPDQRFEALAHRYQEELLKLEPETATSLGDHRYDDRLDDDTQAGIERERAFNRSWLKQIPTRGLSAQNQVDADIWRNGVESRLFELDSVRDAEWNPLVYNVGDAIYQLLARDFAPLPERLQHVKARLLALPAVLAAARANLKNPPRIHTETAIQQNDGLISLIRDDLDSYVKQAPDMAPVLKPAREQAIQALQAYGEWLKTDLLPRSHGDFRLGDARFRQKLRYTLGSDLSKDAIRERAWADIRANQATMYGLALPLYRKWYPDQSIDDHKLVIRQVLHRLSDDHYTADTIVPQATQVLQQATDFVRSHALLTLPDDPVKVQVMPEYQRGVAIASCDAPGPLEVHGETFYNISPPPADWPAARVESFFRENNRYMLEDLTAHEAMPGHYVQLWHAHQCHDELRALFESGVFVEGWAVYAEQVMAENGFGGPEERLEQLKMRLRVAVNALLDQGIHTAGMTQQEAMALMMDEGFQEEGEAAGKWRRACLTSTQLSTYFVGVTEMNDLRQAYMSRHPGTDLKTYHDLLLSFGSPAPRYVRRLLGL